MYKMSGPRTAVTNYSPYEWILWVREHVKIFSVMLSERGSITTSNVLQLLSSQMAHRAWTSAERAGAHTQPGSLGGSGEGNRTCLDERCCRWNGQSPDLH